MKILRSIWFGNVHPNAREVTPNSEYDKLLKLLVKYEDKLNEIMSDEQKDTFEKFKDVQREMSILNECEAFEIGFKLGAKIMIEVMSEEGETI